MLLTRALTPINARELVFRGVDCLLTHAVRSCGSTHDCVVSGVVCACPGKRRLPAPDRARGGGHPRLIGRVAAGVFQGRYEKMGTHTWVPVGRRPLELARSRPIRRGPSDRRLAARIAKRHRLPLRPAVTGRRRKTIADRSARSRHAGGFGPRALPSWNQLDWNRQLDPTTN